MKKIILIALLLTAITTVSAQQTDGAKADSVKVENLWIKGGQLGVNMSQASYSNWSAGGEHSIALDAMLNYQIDNKSDKHLWSNRIELAYGLNNTKSYDYLRKTNDKIYFSSNYGYQVAPKLYASAMVTFVTQFSKGYDYAKSSTEYISDFMAPGYLTIGAGVTWTPYLWLKITFNPISCRTTFLHDDYLSNKPGGSFGVAQGESVLHQLGANMITEVTREIFKNVNLYSRLELYSDYLHNPQNVIVKWDTQLNFKINKWLSAGLNFNLIYDDNIRFANDRGEMVPRLQVRETLGIGLQLVL